MENHIQGRHGAGDEGDGEPESEGSEDAGHGDECDAILGQASEIFDEGEGNRSGFVLCAMQVIEEFRSFVEAEVGGSGLFLDEAADVVANEFGLGGAHPGFESTEGFE